MYRYRFVVLLTVALSRASECEAQTQALELPAAQARPVPSVWDVIGVRQMRESLYKTKQEIGQIPLVRLTGATVVDPLLQVTGLKAAPGQNLVPAGLASPGAGIPPGSAASGPAASGGAPAAAGVSPAGTLPPAGPPAPTQLAKSLAAKKSEAVIAEQVGAIRFLATQDCICYPETIDSLLTLLDDCEEVIRYEVLRALRRGCRGHGGNCSQCPPVGSPHLTCLCDVRVVSRLSNLLLARDPAGSLRERSWRVRQLAKIILRECLAATPVDSSNGTSGGNARPDPPLTPRVSN